MKPPVIVIPGITATSLKDFYPPGPESVWGMIGKDYERAALHPDNLRYEQVEPALLRPDEVFSIPYDEYVKELRHDLTPSRDRPRPVYLFSHDWRQPLDLLAERLAAFVEEVVARTALMKHYARAATPYTEESGKVDLVGHSMGGLIISGYLARHASDHRARKVITMGTPFGGSFEAVIKIITGTSGLDTGVPSSRERETARVTPALYHLLPEKGLNVEDGPSDLPDSLFDAGLWQSGVIETLADYIKFNGIDAASTQEGRLEQARELLQSMLDEARRFRNTIDGSLLENAGLDENDWLAIVGIGDETRLALDVRDRGEGEGPWFELSSIHRRNGYPMPELDDEGEVVADFEDTGDGTVPFSAAEPPFLPTCKLVCVSSDDFGYFEIRDRLIRGLTNLHSMLPSMNRVIKLSVRFLDSDTGRRASAYPGIKGRVSPRCMKSDEDWNPPFVELREEKPDDVTVG